MLFNQVSSTGALWLEVSSLGLTNILSVLTRYRIAVSLLYTRIAIIRQMAVEIGRIIHLCMHQPDMICPSYSTLCVDYVLVVNSAQTRNFLRGNGSGLVDFQSWRLLPGCLPFSM